jgi:hypothetical protein
VIVEVRCAAQKRKCGRLLMTMSNDTGEWVYVGHNQPKPPLGPFKEDGTLRSVYPHVWCPVHRKRPMVDVLPFWFGTHPVIKQAELDGKSTRRLIDFV